MPHQADEEELPLHNHHNVYILGAGFSADAGLPLISNFLVEMRDSHEWLKQQGRNKEAASIARVLKFRLDAASAAYWVKLDLENIEELFSLASASDTKITNDIRIAVAATLDYTRQKNRTKYQVELNLGSGMSTDQINSGILLSRFMEKAEPTRYKCPTYSFYLARLLGMLKNGEPFGESTFITFNYDTLVEDALLGLGLNVDYGTAMGCHPRSKSDTDAIPVFKLHGSVNWTRTANEKITVHSDYKDLHETGKIPELIPPTWKKVFENQIETIWKDALGKLSTATRVIIIGFSMPPTDMHFKYLLAAGLRENLSLREIIFVNKDAASVESRARALLRESYIDDKRIRFYGREFMTFCMERNNFGEPPSLHTLGRGEAKFLQYTPNWTNKPDE